MSTRTTFEDRLLGELQREIELREAGAGEERAKGWSKGSVRRLFTLRRMAVVATACAVVGVATVAGPGSPAESPAYALERHGDGRVELTIKDQGIGVNAQLELAERMRPWGIRVDVVAVGVTCAKSWGDPAVLAINKKGVPEPIRTWPVTLRRGNTLVFENMRGGRPLAKDEIKYYEVKPCIR
ncbi:hypothetical protein [Streptomyces spongiae]|uniref:Uncharacterized protein n=1 Tax=Streptomyces spongiae TaxID=565072 RepID=A0A5N8XMK7_9ACTN|nr:hypothetical protein [Streptomyces spongiae]MPY60673.1 hypothetical protein [Streptomyces spongiae]